MRRWIPFILMVAAVAAYANSFRVPFLYDDANAIVTNPHVRRLWPIWYAASAPPQSTVAGRPVVSLTLALNYAVSGLNVWSYHIFNLLLHLANTLLLFGIARRTLEGTGRTASDAAGLALTIALVWTVHPLLTESVTYVVQRTELLMSCFLLLTLYCVIRDWQLAAVVACALGMGCKEVMVVAPLIVLLYDRAFLAGTFAQALRQRAALYAALAATWIVFAAWGGAGPRSESVGLRFAELTPWQYALTQCGVIANYVRLSAWPHPLVIDYDDWPIAHGLVDVWPAAGLVVALAAATVWALWRRPKLGFLGAWFLLILAPTSSVVPIVTEVAAERRMYLPLAAVITLVMIAASRLTRTWSNNVRAASVGAVVIGFGLMTTARNHDYRSELAIWSDVVAQRPQNPRALVNLGTVLAKLGRTDEALARYNEALRVDPSNPDAHFNLGVTLAGQDKLDAAQLHLEEAVRLVPQSAAAQYSLGVVLAQRGDLVAAATHLAESLRCDSRNAEVHNALGGVLARQGKLVDAEREFNEALRLRPDYADAHANLGFALAQQGNLAAAAQEWETALRFDPGNQRARRALEHIQGGAFSSPATLAV